ncbi:MAG: hypothetical protein AAB447_02115 [Patescibacteria group bacterium]
MLKIYIGTPLAHAPLMELVLVALGLPQKQSGRWSDSAFRHLTSPLFLVTENPTEADYFMLPHYYNAVVGERQYLSSFERLAIEHKKQIIILFPGDSIAKVLINNAIVFRNSQYRKTLLPNEIIMPAFAEDLLNDHPLVLRSKQSKALVGFCGWANFVNFKQAFRSGIRRLFFPRESGVFQKGMYIRKKALSVLKSSKIIATKVIIRSSYSGNEKTISLDPIQARREYIDNIINTDYTLCVKGDGNFSIRLYEVLSLGRIPLFVNTDCVLPLEDVIPYGECLVSVEHADLLNIDQQLAQFHASLTDEKFQIMQKKAREIFKGYLRLDVFFAYTLTNTFLSRFKTN